MNAQELINQLTHLSESNGVQLKDIEVYYRFDFDSDIEDINFLFEDIFDQETNSILESVVLVSKDE
jgi:hypothetical protein